MTLALSILYSAVMVLLLFGITIFIHELGHFLFARWLGLHAETFSIGFGPAIWKKKIRGVTYKIGWIPAGGYVALPQMEPGGGRTLDAEGNEVRLPRVAPWRKIVVALAGPAGNILLAFIIAFVLYKVGKPATPQETSSVVGYVAEDSAAYAAGLREGDRIVEANGRAISNWKEFNFAGALGEQVTITAERDGERITMTLPTEGDALGMKGARGVPGVDGISYCKVGEVVAGSSADAAGVQAGDLILAIDGIEVYSVRQLIELVDKRRDEQVPLAVERGEEQITLQVTPKYDPKLERALIGIKFDEFWSEEDLVVHIPPLEQVREHASWILRTLQALVTPSQAKYAAGGLGGPPMIFAYLWALLSTGIIMALWFTCFVNVNLAILNLMPLPVLDGGHISFALWEIITRRPVNERAVSVLTSIFAVLLIAAMIFLSVRDVDRLIGIGDGRPEAPADTNAAPVEAPAP